VGAASAKHAPSFGAQTALARTDSGRPVQAALCAGPSTAAARSGKKLRVALPRTCFGWVDLAESEHANNE
jgi:hypothetical protein